MKDHRIRFLSLCVAACACLFMSGCSKEDSGALDGGAAGDAGQTEELEMVDPAQIQRLPADPEGLSDEQLERIKALQRVFVEVDGMTVEQWVDNFSRDLNPDRGLAIWERMAQSYTRYCEGRDLSPEGKKELYKIVLMRSMAPVDTAMEQLNLKVIPDSDARMIMEGY